MKNKIITSGIDSEYVLGDLSSFLRNRGYEVLELNFAKTTRSESENILTLAKTNPIIYITSAHVNYTSQAIEHTQPTMYKQYPLYLSPLEILAILNPIKSIFIPHDLLTPFGDNNLSETRVLDLFDVILSPTEEHTLSLRSALPTSTKIYNAGWIKNHCCISKTPDQPKRKIVMFITFIYALQQTLGNKGVVDYLSPLLTKDVSIKFPNWEGVSVIEKLIKKKHPSTEIIPAKYSSVKIIKEADIIICNGTSSIHAESCLLGKPTICLLDNMGLSLSIQYEKLKKYKGLYFHDYRNKQPIPCHIIKKLNAQKNRVNTKTFDFDFVETLISNKDPA